MGIPSNMTSTKDGRTLREEADVQHSRDVEEREEQRRKEDTRSGARRPDTGDSDEPPEPFSGASH